jgi:predicted NBD/HSP70 family sugar kinase
MSYDKKIEITQISQTNKYNVLRCLIREGPSNRSAIAKKLGLSIPTVMAAMDDLSEKKVVRSMGKGEFGVGKPPEIMEMVPDRFFYIGVDIGRTAIRVVINNAVAEPIATIQEPTGDPFPEEHFVDRLCSLILQMAGKLHTDAEHIMGIGIAMPGLIERATGQVLISPDFGWEDVPLQLWLQSKLPYRVLVKNANHSLAVNESFISGDDDVRHTTFCVNLGYGIGSALVIGEEVYTGAYGTSGELGHSVVEKDGPLCKCSNSGCLEAVASGEAIARQAQMIIVHHGNSKIAKLCGGDAAKIDARMVFEAAELGDKSALKILNTAADYIGIGISAAANVLDPDRVILCGGLMRNGPFFFEKIKTSMYEHIIPQASRHLVFSVGTGGEYSTANGACRILVNSLWSERTLPI